MRAAASAISAEPALPGFANPSVRWRLNHNRSPWWIAPVRTTALIVTFRHLPRHQRYVHSPNSTVRVSASARRTSAVRAAEASVFLRRAEHVSCNRQTRPACPAHHGLHCCCSRLTPPASTQKYRRLSGRKASLAVRVESSSGVTLLRLDAIDERRIVGDMTCSRPDSRPESLNPRGQPQPTSGS